MRQYRGNGARRPIRRRSGAATAAALLMIAGVYAPVAGASSPEAEPTPGTAGAPSVMVGGRPVATEGAAGIAASVRPSGGAANVTINGRPAKRVGDSDGCGGIIVNGASNVFVNGRPLATAGSASGGC